ncbi:hypothetical protein [Bradyrhizobium sp. BR 1432]|uniref:hypothetical protein n=1 Tax=Bradyrhizobium sp. BR 1432 TaxID=3447966 RepID=UPI003EE42A15
MDNEPGAAVLSIFEQLIDRIKQMSPKNSGGKPINTRVYSQLTLGMPISPDDYARPWTPIGGSSLAQQFAGGRPGTLPGAAPGGGTEPDVPLPTLPVLRSLEAAWKTALLGRTMLQVVKDDDYREYPTGRHLDFAYESLIMGMRAPPATELSDELKARIKAAERVLYKFDEEGNRIGKTEVHANYLRNVIAAEDARTTLDMARAAANRNPEKLEAFPFTSIPLINAVNRAQEAILAEGGDRVEAAFDTLNAIGVPVQAHMIAKAKREFEAWNLGLTGVPSKIPYSFILPTNWCDPDQPEGFSRLQVTQRDYQSFTNFNQTSGSQFSWHQRAERNSGGGAVSFGFMAFGGRHSSSESSAGWQSSSNAQFRNSFSQSAKGLTIDLEYGLCTIMRPWLISDLFYMRKWTMAEMEKGDISDGTIDGQVNDPHKLLPMIPQQFLVVRNVRISAEEWGADGNQLEERYGSAQGSTMSDQSEFGAAGGVCLGFINFGGTASHAQSSASGQGSQFESRSGSGFFGTTFKNNTLTIKGAQIVAFLSDIVPVSPPE